ncbi:hypothetical protein CYMTET_16580 [Cymbomonas tetramitiformis]|uniref:Carboxylic ester hydrolase n=1 Tax=Cymbomonas tetramitiformis TaxID=36881 RepID=A0AAE0L7T0_9CHLO|nr:hypothetical protein CYMTET_16580 [Cymbomonas tetramitiformis]
MIRVCCHGLVKSGRTTVNTPLGPLQGFEEADGVRSWQGVPFARPPSANLRFRPPQPLTDKWTEPKDCTKPGSMCPQLDIHKNVYLGNEDCLYLNIWVPPSASVGSPADVMLWIYGGAFEIGDGSEFGTYDGRSLASNTSKVVVTFNYRVGIFGFFPHVALLSESEHNTTGNYGLQDQRAAMQWVTENIALFGGNPNKVTLFGESAGAMSVCYHLASPASAGLFARAIMESGNCDSAELFKPWRAAEASGNRVAQDLGCDLGDDHAGTLKCLRGLTTGELQADAWFPGKNATADSFATLAPICTYVPTIDGSPIGMLEAPLETFKRGEGNKVPVIMGSNRDEGTIFVPLLPFVVERHSIHFPLNDQGVQYFVERIMHYNTTTSARVLAQYPSDHFKTEDSRAAAILRDYVILCPTRRALRAMVGSGMRDVWEYRFTYPMHWAGSGILGDYHGSEVFFVFRSALKQSLTHRVNAKDRQMVDIFTSYWSSFASVGNPNNSTRRLPSWPRYTSMSDLHQELTVPPTPKRGLKSVLCDFWDNVQKSL